MGHFESNKQVSESENNSQHMVPSLWPHILARSPVPVKGGSLMLEVSGLPECSLTLC